MCQSTYSRGSFQITNFRNKMSFDLDELASVYSYTDGGTLEIL